MPKLEPEMLRAASVPVETAGSTDGKQEESPLYELD
jgi:hypothetical protein